ncbi:MAG: EVE domain-containing protein, partial [Chloroflexota bacterium]|nr:EVE domain-containing protein [Chloroflexota bacterium]
MTFWLLKTEPSEFSFDDLVARGVEPWDGVRNPMALRNLASAREGETCVIYHTGEERQAVGLANVVRAAYPDPRADDPRVVLIDVRAGERFPSPVRLEQMKADPRFADSPLVRMGRLSVVQLTETQYAALLE